MLKGLIIFEGGEGCGKTTQIKLLSKYLTRKHVPHVTTREPGGTPLGEHLRDLMLNEEITDPITEYLIITTARRQHLNEVILPALKSGKLVLCDRFTYSTLVYQCIVKGMDRKLFNELNDKLLGDIKPELCIYFDLPPNLVEERTARRKGAAKTVYDRKGVEFHENLRKSYLRVADSHDEMKVIDANQTIDEIASQVLELLNL